MIVIILGAPGSGKGTQSKILSAKYGFTHLATGDIFRGEIAAKTALGNKAAGYVKAGRLVPDSIVTEMVAGRLALNGHRYLLDGFPRNVEQAKSLAEILAPQKGGVDLVVYLNLARAEALKRLITRCVCESCGAVYNLSTRPPRVAGKCDLDGGKVLQREDDERATAEKRLMVYEDLTQPLVAYYKAEQVFCEVDAAQPLETVTKDVAAHIEALLAKS